ncbi:hypothetical protein GUITHDRAFT_135124 [Guillardia theta CCMP2712]|uniref:SAM-dependent MTase RsmB/NOP-type domain-containing protein n=1 Tax=Guillardia theta (strain CCMP2712) TaxID=905079 RepID=L1JPC7_GUITC|nr:hypothetical protein GUITHDRAFT_135124 [Guillardia theta CCMP2712]EKX50441.1 hypothetical protein GUITHDRAFT_135124 [Guillardia theta CCMP2712]|eukprot:XP_005837421.1 hypothetical protein GUITHDRAFT_135124 [Guillardia theta CCMP2712]
MRHYRNELVRQLAEDTTFNDLPKVLVGRLCGEAVMQGAQIFAPGIAAAPYSMNQGDLLAVYGKQPKATDVVIDTSKSVFLGIGRACMNRNGIFGKDPRGIGIEVRRGREWRGGSNRKRAWSASRSSRLQADSLHQLQLYQRQMIRQAVMALKPGGRLVYSTCTLNPQENEGNVAWMLRNFDVQLVEHPLASLGLHGMSCPGLEDDDARKLEDVDLFPGFFAACLQKLQ